MKKWLSVLLAVAMLVSLASTVFAEEAPAPDYSSGTPWPDIDLEGVVTPDTPVNLRDNFALAVNKDDILSLEIPEGYPYAGTIMDIALLGDKEIKDMFLGDAPASHDAKLAYDLFWLMMDWDYRNALGVAPLKEMTDAVDAITSVDALTAYFTETPIEKQIGSLFSVGPMVDFADSSRYILIVSSGSLLLSDSAEYSALTPSGEVRKAALTELATKMLLKLGYSEEETASKIANAFEFESMLAPTIYTNEASRSPDFYAKIYNIFSRAELEAAQGSLPVLPMFEQVIGYPEAERYLVMEPAFLEKLNELYIDENLPLMRDLLIVKGAIAQAGSLDRECYEWDVACDNAISGAIGMLDDETAFSGIVSGMLAWPVARLYTESYLKQEDKDRISLMIDEILGAYHGILADASFLSDETRAKAVEKLEAIDKRVLYPDSWEKYECPDLNFASREEGGTLWDAELAIALHYLRESIEDYSAPVDKEKWSATPQTVNCFYDAQTNSVSILGAFARGSVYNTSMSDEELYGTLGAVIGHEISHAFDSSGAQFDKDGNMTMWWTEDDYAAFQARNARMVDYYNAMHPWEGQDFYGSIMTGEACADMAGIKVMLLLAAEKPDFDYDLFFRTFAKVWLTKDSLQMAYTRINDNHPMGYLRINATLQQYDEFLNCYGITEGDGMYLAPENRVTIW